MVAPMRAPAVPKTVKGTDGAAMHTRRMPEIEIVKADMVPRKYCEPVRGKILAAAKAGIEFIPGVRITWVDEPIVKGG